PCARVVRRRRLPAGTRDRRVKDGALILDILRAQAAIPSAQRDERPAVPAGHLPRRAPRVPAHAIHVPRHPSLAAARRAGRLRPDRRRAHGPHLDRPLHRAGLRRRRDHPRPRASPRQARRRLALGGPLRLHAPHAHGPRGAGRRARPARGGRDVLHLPPLGGPLPDPDGASDARPGRGRGAHARGAGPRRRRGGVPRGHHVPGALPAPLLQALRGAQRQHRARGDELPRGAVPPDDGARVEGHGPHLLLHEPAARVRGDVPEPAPRGVDVRGGEEPRGRGQLRAADTRRHARVRVHHPHQEGQVHGARGKRRRRQRQAGLLAEPREGCPRLPAPLTTLLARLWTLRSNTSLTDLIEFILYIYLYM
uniref:Uncharacterized protein n=1 Tax=Zea mays TaxID=4577 RepID=A0A804QSJ1_MAIZE